MSQQFISAQTIKKDGDYCVRVTRTQETDLLSVYVNRVKKMSSDGGEAVDTLKLEAGDLVEATGELTIE